MFQNFIKITFRNLLKYKTFSIVNLLGLSVGLTCFMLIALWIKDETSYDQFHEYGNRIHRVMMNIHFSNGSIETQEGATGLLSQALKEEVPEITYASTMDYWTNTLVSYQNQSLKEDGRYVGTDFLKMFSFPLVKGNKETALSAPNSIVISQRLADKIFPGIEPLGKVVKIADQTEHQVTGVMENLPSNTIFDFEFLLPMDEFLKRNAWARDWNNNGLHTFVMLDEGVDVQAVNTKIKDIVANHGPQDNTELFLQPLTDIYLKTDYENGTYAGGGRIEYVRMFGFIALLMLLIACINFMNLSTARATVRAKEVGVRKVVGAGRRALTFQFIGEALLMCLLAAGLSLIVIDFALPWFNQLTEKQIVFPFGATTTWAVLGGIVLITGLLAGAYPAFVLSAFRPVSVLKSGVGSSKIGQGGSAMLRKGLVVAQFAIAVFLIAGMVIVQRQLDFLQTKNLGYEKEQLLYITLNSQMQRKFDSFKSEVTQVPGVLSVSASHNQLTEFLNASDNFVWEGKDSEDNRMFVYEIVKPNYLTTIGAELIEGRDFSEAFLADTANLILNESAVKQMSLQPPYTGQQLEAWGNKGQIVGVVKDFHFTNLKYDMQPLVLAMNHPFVWTMYVRLDSGKPTETIHQLEQVTKKIQPCLSFRIWLCRRVL